MTAHPEPPRRYPHPALFGILVLPFGAAVGFLQVAVPFWLAQRGMPLTQIGALSAAAFLPHGLKLFWVWLPDVTGRKKAWYLACGNLVALLLAVASFMDPMKNYGLYVVVLTALQAAAATTAASLNALMATTPREQDKGRAGGFYMAGNVGGTSLLGAGAIWLSRIFSPTTSGLVLAGLMVLSTLGAFTLDERAGIVVQSRNALDLVAKKVWEILKDLGRILVSREGFTGLLICLAPVGCGALTNLFSAMADDYHASASTVEMVNGLGGGISGALGSILGGYLADKMNRRLAYAVSGGITALFAVAMVLSPMNPTTYTWATLGYSFANGISFAAFAGMVLEMVSAGAVATKYALFVAASNMAISYTTYLDGWASSIRGWGTRGTVGFDAAITFAGIGFLLLMVAVTRMWPARAAASPPQAAA